MQKIIHILTLNLIVLSTASAQISSEDIAYFIKNSIKGRVLIYAPTISDPIIAEAIRQTVLAAPHAAS